MSAGNDDWLSSNAVPPQTEAAATTGPGDDTEGAPLEERRCAQCSTRLDPDQFYCLECGWASDLAPALAKPRGLGPLVAVGLIAFGLIGGGLAFAALQDDGSSDGASLSTAEATTPLAPATTTAPGTTDGGLPPDPAATATGGELPTTAAPEDVVSDWPSGQTAWTTIVSSVRSSAEAANTKEQVRAAGEPAGLLFSSDHPELRPGFWVVFSGVFNSREEASAHARAIGQQFAGTYVRRISA